MDAPVNYSGHPESVGEVRARLAEDASKWTPRDCLIEMLRQIDNGAEIDTLVICYRQCVDGERRARFSQSTQDGLVTTGLLAHVMARIGG